MRGFSSKRRMVRRENLPSIAINTSVSPQTRRNSSSALHESPPNTSCEGSESVTPTGSSVPTDTTQVDNFVPAPVTTPVGSVDSTNVGDANGLRHSSDTTTDTTISFKESDYDSSGRLKVALKYGQLHPSHKCAHIISQIFEEIIDDKGYNWQNVTSETKNLYWREFKRRCVWDPLIEPGVEHLYHKKAAEHYSSMTCRIRKGVKRANHLSDDCLQKWKEEWEKESYKKKCNQFSLNRCSKKGGPGSGVSRHTGGSISHAAHAEILEKELQRKPLLHEIFERTHTKKGTNEMIDERSKKVKEQFEELWRERSTPTEGSTNLTPTDETEIFLSIVDGVNKNRVYGVGSLSNSLCKTKSSSVSVPSSLNQDVQDELTCLRNTVAAQQKLLEEKCTQIEGYQSQLQQMEQRLEERMLAMIREIQMDRP